jgi:MFS family permease
MSSSFWRALHQPAFAWLWTGQTISRFGDSLYQVALAWWVLKATGSATAMGLVIGCTMLPMVIFLLIGGVMVDRVSRKYLMLASDLARALVMLVMSVLAATDHFQIGYVYAIAFFFGFVDAFFQPAYNAIIPNLLTKDDLPSANSLTSLSRQLSNVLGPLAAAVLMEYSGASVVFGLNCLSFLIAAVCLLKVPNARQKSTDQPTGNVLHEAREGLQFILAQPWLWITIAVFSMVNITSSGPLRAALPTLVERGIKADAGVLGLLMSMMAAGAVLCAVLMGSIKRLRHRGLIAYGSTMLGGLAVLMLGLPLGQTIVVGALCMFVAGFCSSAFDLAWNHSLQEIVPATMLGRVYSVDMLGSYVFLAAGFPLVGALTDSIGFSVVFIGCGGVTILLCIAALLHPAVRRLD